MATIKTPARDLRPGDVVRFPDEAPGVRMAVLCVAHVDPGPVGLALGRMGEVPRHLERVATVSWQPDALVDVDRPDLTPAQATAGQLLEMVRTGAATVAELYPGWANRADQLIYEIEQPRQAELRFDRVTPKQDGTFQHSYRGRPVPGAAPTYQPVPGYKLVVFDAPAEGGQPVASLVIDEKRAATFHEEHFLPSRLETLYRRGGQ